MDTGADSGAFRGSEEWSSSASLGDRGTVTRFGQYLVGGVSYSFVDGSTLRLEMGADSNLDVKNAGQVLWKEGRQRRLMKKLGGQWFLLGYMLRLRRDGTVLQGRFVKDRQIFLHTSTESVTPSPWAEAS